jgi:hypothetical protein
LFLTEVTEAPEEIFKSVKNRFGKVEVNLKTDFENREFEKQINLGGNNNHYYFDYEQ